MNKEKKYEWEEYMWMNEWIDEYEWENEYEWV